MSGGRNAPSARVLTNMNSRSRLWVQWGSAAQNFNQGPGRARPGIADCDIVVNDPRASRHHLVFFRDGDVSGGVRRQASFNGSFVHGQRIQQFAIPPRSDSGQPG